MESGFDPLGSFPGMDGDRFFEHLLGERLVQQDPCSSDHPSWSGQSSMPADEAWLRDAVAIHEKQVFAAGGCNGLVGDGGRSKPLVGMPDMMNRDRETAGGFADQISCFPGRSIIGDHQFEAMVILGRKSTQGSREGVRPVVGGKDDGDGGGSWSFCSCSLLRSRIVRAGWIT